MARCWCAVWACKQCKPFEIKILQRISKLGHIISQNIVSFPMVTFDMFRRRRRIPINYRKVQNWKNMDRSGYWRSVSLEAPLRIPHATVKEPWQTLFFPTTEESPPSQISTTNDTADISYSTNCSTKTIWFAWESSPPRNFIALEISASKLCFGEHKYVLVLAEVQRFSFEYQKKFICRIIEIYEKK